ncbi:hypothetical protein BAUCODRAFT_548464 [Baudoinia panamericana UAMH 10762]|uniref:Uncharacterized protein n=1 Tax=Baudoinia panamericana (strain UAMH 10762) TaxID=717646 RepID=M2LJN5_BAUPA|nr:uncharacterized protein BAUCODRAFT_548464 [Baudoinia panamericana UAMH 10762]EMC94437.1 hypothetical protein BAUCODRAFT_548464 [Baudoinia panamericana UAMH 10762]
MCCVVLCVCNAPSRDCGIVLVLVLVLGNARVYGPAVAGLSPRANVRDLEMPYPPTHAKIPRSHSSELGQGTMQIQYRITTTTISCMYCTVLWICKEMVTAMQRQLRPLSAAAKDVDVDGCGRMCIRLTEPCP